MSIPSNTSGVCSKHQFLFTALGSAALGTMTSVATISVCHPLFTLKTLAMSGMGIPSSVRMLYVGYNANIICDVSNQAVAFLAYGVFANEIMRRKELTSGEKFLGGLFAGLSAAPLLSALERVMILQQVAGSEEKKSISTTVKKITDLEGFKGFSRGLPMAIARESVNSCCFFGLSQLLHPFVEKYVRHPDLSCGIAYQIAGAIAGFVTTPFDLIKTCMQNQVGQGHGLRETARNIKWSTVFIPSALSRILTISTTMMCMGYFSNNLPKFIPLLSAKGE